MNSIRPGTRAVARGHSSAGTLPTRTLLIVLIALLIAPVMTFTAERAGAYAPANDAFYETWARSDLPVSEGVASRTWMWGPRAITPVRVEEYADAHGGKRVVQYFDKTRMEINDGNGASNDPWFVTNGLLATELVTGRVQVGDEEFLEFHPANIPVAGDLDDPVGPTYATMNMVLDVDARTNGEVIVQEIDRAGTIEANPDRGRYEVRDEYFVTQTGQNVASVFWEFMNSDGTIAEQGEFVDGDLFPDPFYATGFPITEAYWTTVHVGSVPMDVLVQVFERRVLTYTPGNPDGWQVEAGNVGLHYHYWMTEVADAIEHPDAPSLPAMSNDDAACLDSHESEFLALINEYRQEHGLSTLENSAALNIASYFHSEDMGTRDYFAHDSPDGITPRQRMVAAGYDYNTTYGENIAAGQETAQIVFERWRDSPGHNANMLNPDFDVIGIARVQTPDSQYGIYWTTKFGGHVDAAPDC